MPEKKAEQTKKTFSPDWLVRGVLTKVGETFDKFTGRNWKPSSSLATSELIERLKRLLDAEAREDGKGKFVPHNIKLKTQWDKFSTDSEKGMKKLENELLTAAIDHINDNRYHTYAPLKVEVKPDYFTEGVKLQASFGEFAPEPDEPEAEVNVTVPQIKVGEFIPPPPPEPEEPEIETYIAEFSENGKQKTVNLEFTEGKRMSVGRTKENDLSMDDISVSKNHASLMINAEGKLLVADTGSTNGTFINSERIAYGRAFAINEGDQLKFGNVEVFIRKTPEEAPFVSQTDLKTAVFEQGSIPAEVFQNDAASNQLTENYSPQTQSNQKQTNENHVSLTEDFEGNWEDDESEKNKAQQTNPGINLDFGNSE